MATASEYLKKPYSRTLIPVGDGTFFAEILEFPGCFAEGTSPDEAYKNLEDVAESWIEAAQGQGQGIPEPFATHDFSGRIALRIPRSIHKKAAKFAEMDNTSLNQFFLTAVAARVGAEEFAEHLLKKLEAKCMAFSKVMPSYTFNLHGPMKLTGPVQMIATQVFSPASPRQTFFPLTTATGGIQMTALSHKIINEEDALNG